MITGEAFVYLIKVNIALVVFYLFYRLLFSRDTFFVIRRGCLWMILGMSFVYPLIMFSFGEEQKVAIQQTVVQYAANLLPEVLVTPVEKTATIGVWDVIGWCYYAVVFLLLARIIIQIYSIVRHVRKGKREICCSLPVIALSGEISPFSFFKWIFVNPSRYDSSDLQEIMAHEKTHADQYHSLDVIVCEILCSLFWMNPAMWLLKREIRRNLEFLADKRVVYSGFDRKAYQYHLLRLSHPSAAAQIVNKFNVTPLKKRIMMMNKKRTSRMGLIKYALLVPVMGLLVLSSNVQAIVRLNGQAPVFSSQDSITVKGIVVDENNVPLDRTTVLIKGSGVGTMADAKGEFTIKVLPNTVLIFSYVGKQNQFITIKNEQKIKVKMEKANVVMDELVVLPKSDDEDIFQVVEEMPQFPGGNVQKFLAQSIRYPKEAMEKNIQGKVFVQFVIDKEGVPGEFKVARSVHPLLDQEALRIMQLMPNWKPGTQRGKPVRVSYTVPINFQLGDTKKE